MRTLRGRVAFGMLSNEAYIFSHPGFCAEIVALNAELLSAAPAGDHNPPERLMEQKRWQDRQEREQLARKIKWTLD